MDDRLTLDVGGMSCTGCEDNVVSALKELPGIDSVTADHEANRVTIEGQAAERDVHEAIEDAGYTVR